MGEDINTWSDVITEIIRLMNENESLRIHNEMLIEENEELRAMLEDDFDDCK